jgi:hypothetical protein
MALTINQVNHAIMAGTFTNDQLNSIVTSIKLAKNLLTWGNLSKFQPGDSVSFVTKGKKIIGTVERTLQKNVHVKETLSPYEKFPHKLWRVPAFALERHAG